MTPEEQQTQIDPQQAAQMQQEIIAEAVEEIKSIQKDMHSAWKESNNLVPEIDEDVINDISERVVDEYKIDDDSLCDWRKELEEAHKLARQLRDDREYAGEKISDIKYPIIATACIQFQARAMPAIIKGNKVVRSRVVGKDTDGVKAARGERVSNYMSWQLADDNDHWVPDMDGALMGLPLWGVMFKKTYHNGTIVKNESDTIYPEDLVVNYYAKDFEPRATHKVYLYPNQIRERINTGAFVDFEYDIAVNDGDNKFKDGDEKKENDSRDEDTPHLFLEQHRWYDLDDDGYQEPYVVTVHWDTKTVVRMTPRWCQEDAKYDAEGNVISIKPFSMFTRIPFMPAFDGSFYCMGFGRLLSPLNHAIDTIINQLLDAGKHQVRPSGFVGTNVRFGKHQGSLAFKAGEWKKVQSVGDLKQNIFQLQFGEPSTVLFQTLGLLMEASNRLASMSDVLSGEVPKGDIPAATTLSIIEQGLKVYTAVHLRIHRSLKTEFTKLRRLNRLYAMELNEEYKAVIDDNFEAHRDFKASDYDIVPVSNESDISDTMRTLKADALMQHRGTGLNDTEIVKRWLEAHGFEETDKITEATPQEPDPMLLLKDREVKVKEAEVKIEEMRTKLEYARMFTDNQEKVYKMLKDYSTAVKNFADAESQEAGTQMEQYKQWVDGALATSKEFLRQMGGGLGGQIQQGNVQPMGERPGNAGVPAQAPMGGGGQEAGLGVGGLA